MSFNYCGGIPQLPKPDLMNVFVFPNHIEVCTIFKKVKIPMENIKNSFMKTDEQILNDVTLTRLLAIGIFAFGAKKKKKHVTNYLIIDYVDNGIDVSAVFTGDKIAKLNADILKARQSYLKRNPPKTAEETTSTSTSNDDIYSEIEKLHNLMEKGIITEEEFTSKKRQLLGV